MFLPSLVVMSVGETTGRSKVYITLIGCSFQSLPVKRRNIEVFLNLGYKTGLNLIKILSI